MGRGRWEVAVGEEELSTSSCSYVAKSQQLLCCEMLVSSTCHFAGSEHYISLRDTFSSHDLCLGELRAWFSTSKLVIEHPTDSTIALSSADKIES